MPWSPEQYERFRRERELPFSDALALVGALPPRARVIDLGCGTGALTAKLAVVHPEARVLGIDTSPEMLAEAKRLEGPRLRFVKAAIEALDQIGPGLLGDEGEDARWDLIFSHAAIHWVPEHARLIPRLFAQLAPGGRLVVQLPTNDDHPSQDALRAVADEAPFRAALSSPVRPRPTLTAAAYAELLWREGARDLVAIEKVYPHELPDADAVVEWIRGTAVVPYLERLPQKLHDAFVERLRVVMREAIPGSPVFFGFKRTLFAASRAA
jgi:trans-aconitate 2-methyltransferase